jgi:hypothetical protein
MSKTSPKFLLKFAGSLLLALGGLGLALGFAGPDDKIEGSWVGTVTATNPPLGSFADLITFVDEGGVIESRRLYVPNTPLGSLLETPGHGEWKKVGRREYQVNFIFLLQGAPDNPNARGLPLGTDNISIRVRRNDQGTQLSGTFRSDIKDPNGNVVFTITGTYSATRIEATP